MSKQPTGRVRQHQAQAQTGAPRAGLLGGLFWVIGWAAIFAAVIQIARPPDDVPAPLAPGVGEVPAFAEDFEGAAKGSRRLIYQEQAVNAFLQNRLKASKGPLPASIARFERAFVNLETGKVRLTKEYRLLGYPIYVAGYFEPSLSNGAFRINTERGAIGRLPIDALIFDRIDTWLFSEFVEGLSPERAALEKMKRVIIRPGEAVVVSKS
ncbi:MAG TPA: hypothetical protein VIT91_15050 [Chthoniobacterales bacterium]